MSTLPSVVFAVLMPFAPLFTAPTFRHIQKLLAGAILTPGSRTVASCLRAVGLGQHASFQNFHRVLNRVRWSPRQGSRLLLDLLLRTFVPNGPIIVGLDDTIERRRGAQIKAKGIYRDPVRSSLDHFAKCSGLRWLCLMLLAPVPFAGRVWALPCFTTLCPSLRFFQKYRQPRQPKKLTDWARQMLLQIRRWYPERPLLVVADSSFAVGELLWSWSRSRRGGPGSGYAAIHTITRLRLDAALFEPALPRQAHQMGRPRKKGQRLPTPKQILEDEKTLWQRFTVEGWYASSTASPTSREVELCSGTAIWTNNARPALPIRWVLVRDPLDLFAPQALLCTDLHRSAPI